MPTLIAYALLATLATTLQAARLVPVVRSDMSPLKPAAAAAGYSEVAAKAAPAVVSIITERGKEGGGLGSGVIVSPDGFILTNGHLISKAGRITVTVPGRGSDFRAKVVGIDSKTDVGVIKIEGKDFPAAVFGDSSKLSIGDVVLAIGSPFGIGQTVTMGIVSALSRSNIGIEDYEDFIQTDAAINPGNSGGALIDVQGRLIGLNTAILSPTGGSLGIGFAVPANLVRSIMESLARQGRVVRGFLGAVMQDLSPGLSRRFGVDEDGGALIGEITPGGPAERAGLKIGDVVTALGGKPVRGSSAMRLAVTQFAPGSKVPIVFVRDGRREAATAVLGRMPDEKDAVESLGGSSRSSEGLSLYDLTPDVSRKLGLPAALSGALVVEIEPGSSPWRAGLRPGDVIIEIEQEPVRSATEAVAELNKVATSEALLRVWSRGSQRFLALPRKD